MRKTDDKTPQLADLRCFVQAAEHKSMTAAAAATGAAQSAFSRQLVRLEAALGGRLLHRTGRGVALTDLGRRVLPRAKALVDEAKALADDAAGRWSRPAGFVDVGLLPAMTRPLASELFARVSTDFPQIRLRLHEAYSGEIQAMLGDGLIDIGTLNRYRPLRREAQDALLTSQMCLIVAAGSPLARAKTVKFAELAALPLVMPQQPNSLRGVVEEIAARRRMTLNVALEVDSSTAMKDGVMRCGLHATLPAHAVIDEVARGELRAVPMTHPVITQATIVESTRRRPASAAVREVERLLRVLIPRMQAAGAMRRAVV